MKRRDHSAEYYWRLEQNEDYFRDYRKTRTDKKFVGGYVKKPLADKLQDAAKRLGKSQNEIIAMALSKELSDDLG